MELVKDCLLWSKLCLLISVGIVVIFGLFANRSVEGTLRLKGYKTGILILGVAGALGLLHYAVLWYEVETGQLAMSRWEAFCGSLVRTGKGFGVDENLDDFLKTLKCVMTKAGIGDGISLKHAGCYAGALFVLAPIVGGIGLLEVLAGVFPRLRLIGAGFIPFKDKYYFSELNDGSLELARSICRMKLPWGKKFTRPILVFTGVDPEGDDAGNNRRVNEAKALGAICLRADLNNAPKTWLGKKKYLLLSENEAKVLQQLAALGDVKNDRELKNTEVFFSVADDAYEPIDKQIQGKVRGAFEAKKKKAAWEKQLPIFTPVRTNFNLVTNLLTEIPLFEPLIDKEKKPDGSRDLVVSILGAGGLGMEMFLSTYWMGQMLDCNLIINVYSQEEKADFEARLDHINPEILETEKPNSKHLYVDRDGKRSAKPYFQFNYVQCTLGSGNLKQIAAGVEASDYCFVALGSDMENIDMASRLCRCVGEYHIVHQKAKTVIAYVVYDPKVAAVLNREQQHAHFLTGTTDVYMRAVGTLEEVYSVRNVFMPDVEAEANAVYQAYMALQDKEKRVKESAKRFKKSEYDCRASIAQAKHKPYKMYSTGLLTTSLFNCDDEGRYAEDRMAEMDKAKKLLEGDPTQCDLSPAAYQTLLHRISWLEHRRWNAFTRIMGFRSTKLHTEYFRSQLSHKHMPLRLHPCLVECDEQGIRSGLDEKFLPVKGEDFSYLVDAERDLLDDLTYDLSRLIQQLKEAAANGDGRFTDQEKEAIEGLSPYDFKLYDYFKYE